MVSVAKNVFSGNSMKCQEMQGKTHPTNTVLSHIMGSVMVGSGIKNVSGKCMKCAEKERELFPLALSPAMGTLSGG